MADLLNWGVVNYWGSNVLSGVVIGHPKLKDGTVIRSSEIETITAIESDRLEAVTYSGTHYKLITNEINVADDIFENTVDWLKKSGISDDIIGNIKKTKTNKDEELIKRLDSELIDGELQIGMAGNQVVYAYYKDGSKVKKCSNYTHVGTFQDSVLIQLANKVDFRYFPRAIDCEIYHWSDELKVKIENKGESRITFSGNGKTTVIETGTVQELSTDMEQEGLMSPDCVNGKSALGSMLECILNSEEDKESDESGDENISESDNEDSSESNNE